MSTTVVRSADWVIAWDAAAERHVYRRAIDVAFAADRIVHVGPSFSGQADRVIDGRDRMVMPGLVNVHSHPGSEPALRSIREEHGVAGQYMSGLFERSQAFGMPDAPTRAACLEIALSEMITSGVTTVVDIGMPSDGWVDIAARSGMRFVFAPGYASARWKMTGERGIGYEWDEARGEQQFGAALAFIDALAGHPAADRLSGMLSPLQIDTCTETLLKSSRDAARERGIPLTVHLAQGVTEVAEMIARHRRTPIRWAADIDLLGPGTVLGHALFTDAHSWVRAACGTTTDDDIAAIAASGASVAHCPTPFARYGQMLESFGRYTRAGIAMAIGTDTIPHDMLEEIRTAATLARIADRDVHATSVGEVFAAATIGGARALGRSDLGRIAPGAKADLVLVDLNAPGMQPARDPLRSLVYHSASRAVSDVFVDGRAVLTGGKLLTLDPRRAAPDVAAGQARMAAGVPQRDYRQRTADVITPLSLPTR